MKTSLPIKKRVEEGGASGSAVLFSRIHVSTLGRTEEKKISALHWNSTEPALSIDSVQLPVLARSCGQQNEKLTNINHLICWRFLLKSHYSV